MHSKQLKYTSLDEQYDNSPTITANEATIQSDRQNSSVFLRRSDSSISIVGNILKDNHPKHTHKHASGNQPVIPPSHHTSSNYSLFNLTTNNNNNRSDTYLNLFNNSDEPPLNYFSHMSLSRLRPVEVLSSLSHLQESNLNSQMSANNSNTNQPQFHIQCQDSVGEQTQVPQEISTSIYLSTYSQGAHGSRKQSLVKELDTFLGYPRLKRATSEPSVNLVVALSSPDQMVVPSRPPTSAQILDRQLKVPAADLLNPQLIPSVVRKSLIDLHNKSMQAHLVQRPQVSKPSQPSGSRLFSASRLFGLLEHRESPKKGATSSDAASSLGNEGIGVGPTSKSNLAALGKTVFTQQRKSPNKLIVKGPENYV